MQKTKIKGIPDNAHKVFTGVLYDVYQWEQKLFDGSTTTFERLIRSDIVNVIPITIDGKIIATRQSQPSHKDFLSMPGGRVDPKENNFDAIKRELLEETGYQAQTWYLWQKKQFLSNIVCDSYIYIAGGCKKISAQSLDAGEKIDIKLLKISDWLTLIEKDDFRDFEITIQILKIKHDPKKWHKFLALLTKVSKYNFL